MNGHSKQLNHSSKPNDGWSSLRRAPVVGASLFLWTNNIFLSEPPFVRAY